jgi:hypothetical protein
MSNKIPSWRHELQENSVNPSNLSSSQPRRSHATGTWRKRPDDLHTIIPDSKVRDFYIGSQRYIGPNGSTFARSMDLIAREQGCGSKRTCQRRFEVLYELGLAHRQERRSSRTRNLHNRFTLIRIDELFLGMRLSPTGDKFVMGYNNESLITKASTTPPAPQGGTVGCGDRRAPVDSRPRRHAERRSRRHREVRERGPMRRCKVAAPPAVLTATEQAAVAVMERIGVAPRMWLTRAAVVLSLEAWMAETGGVLAAAVNCMVARWKAYETCDWPRLFTFGAIGFFQGNHWRSEDGWGLDYAKMKLRRQARIGVSDAAKVVDLDAVRDKMAGLLANFDFEGYDDGDMEAR